MAIKFRQVTKTINGKEYVAQFSGLSTYYRAIDSSYIDGDSKNLSLEKMNSYVLENAIVEPPHLTIDDFDDLDELNEVVKFGQDVMRGKIKENFPDKAGTKATDTK